MSQMLHNMFGNVAAPPAPAAAPAATVPAGNPFGPPVATAPAQETPAQGGKRKKRENKPKITEERVHPQEGPVKDLVAKYKGLRHIVVEAPNSPPLHVAAWSKIDCSYLLVNKFGIKMTEKDKPEGAARGFGAGLKNRISKAEEIVKAMPISDADKAKLLATLSGSNGQQG